MINIWICVKTIVIYYNKSAYIISTYQGTEVWVSCSLGHLFCFTGPWCLEHGIYPWMDQMWPTCRRGRHICLFRLAGPWCLERGLHPQRDQIWPPCRRSLLQRASQQTTRLRQNFTLEGKKFKLRSRSELWLITISRNKGIELTQSCDKIPYINGRYPPPPQVTT